MTTKYPKEFPAAIRMLDIAQSKLCEPFAIDGNRDWISKCKDAISKINEARDFLVVWMDSKKIWPD